MTQITLKITPSKTGPNFFICSNVEHRLGVATGRTIDEAKVAGELMLYKIKAAQDMALAEGKDLSDRQPRIEHPIEVDFEIEEDTEVADCDVAKQLDHLITIGVDNEGYAIVQEAIAEVRRLQGRVAELEQNLSAAHQVIAGTATITERFPDTETPRVDVREVAAGLADVSSLYDAMVEEALSENPDGDAMCAAYDRMVEEIMDSVHEVEDSKP